MNGDVLSSQIKTSARSNVNVQKLQSCLYVQSAQVVLCEANMELSLPYINKGFPNLGCRVVTLFLLCRFTIRGNSAVKVSSKHEPEERCVCHHIFGEQGHPTTASVGRGYCFL